MIDLLFGSHEQDDIGLTFKKALHSSPVHISMKASRSVTTVRSRVSCLRLLRFQPKRRSLL